MDKQGLVVIALILIAWVLFQTFVRGPEWKKYQDELVKWEERQAKKKAEEEAGKQGGAQVDSATPAAPSTATPPAQPEQPVAVQPVQQHPHKPGLPFATSQHALTLTTTGASVETLTFKEILDTPYVAVAPAGYDDRREREPLMLLKPYKDVEARSFALEPLDERLVPAARGEWKHEGLPNGGHRFSLVLPNGIEVVKTFSAPAAPPANGGGDEPKKALPLYHFDLTVEVRNPTNQPIEFGYDLLGPAGLVEDSGDTRTGGITAVGCLQRDTTFAVHGTPAHKFTSTEVGELKVEAATDKLTYYGLTSKYFAAVVIPRSRPIAGLEAMGLLQRQGLSPAEGTPMRGQAVAWGRMTHQVFPAGTSRTDTYQVYIGPKQKAVFEAETSPYKGLGLEKLIDYGWFEFMARILLWVLGGFHAIVGNWGVAIIMLTFLVRSILLPLSIWSQKNMFRMQKLAPELNKLKEKYARKDGSMTPEAQRQFSMEQMELMRKTGVNPVGCLGPIFLQLPVFIGLWNALNYAFELRSQPFMLWINDLSVPDVLFRLPFTLPLLGTDAFSVLPLIMVFTYWLTQKLQPVPTDPRAAEQAKMMKWIIPLFGFMLYTSPSGLMLYFITSSIWTIAESKWVKKHLEKTEGPLPAGAMTPPAAPAM